MSKFSIFSPIGGFGNHLRWLLLLDDQFKSDIFLMKFAWNNIIYNDIKGDSWPDYSTIIKNFYGLEIADNIREEIIEKCQIKLIKFTSIENKIDFLKNDVYPQSRSYDNWLYYERLYRTFLNQFINFDHYINTNFNKSIIMTIDPILAYRSYVKFNSNLNSTQKNHFLDSIKFGNLTSSKFADTNTLKVKLVNGDRLFNETLDLQLYLDVIEFFNLDNNYDLANSIHKLWYDGHKRSEQDIVTDMINLYGYKDK